MEEEQIENVDTPAEVPTVDEESPKAKRKRGHLKHPVDRFFELIDATERGEDLVSELHLQRTEPGWTVRIELVPEEGGHPRETMHYDSPDSSVGELFRGIMNEFASVLLARARDAEDELLRIRSAIVRSLPPSERQPVTTRRRRVRRSNGEPVPKRRRRAKVEIPPEGDDPQRARSEEPELEAPITDGP